MFFFHHLVRRTSHPLFALLLLAFSVVEGFSQSCSRESITAKYWQYRENLNKHFVLTDRDPVSGCVGDGIGQNATDLCKCSKAGYSLPATSIDQLSQGSHGMGDRNNSDKYPEWYDTGCAEAGPFPGTHWHPADTPKIHNALSVGSETPHQMGWYWVTLATEYQLLRENGQNAEAQRTLEELFLGLQAYRRLDIQANCLARARYQEITDDYETQAHCFTSFHGAPCLCGGKYRGNSEKWNFEVPCPAGCTYTPNTSGYSGFFLREDATQGLEKMLHDTTEDKWNIDVVGGNCYSMSLKPPCTDTFSQACYLVHRRGFMSQDGVFGLMIGLAMIKRFIPPSATVTLCDGTTHSPLDMAVQIASNITNRIDNTTNDGIAWPKSYDCCNKEVFLGGFEGGSLNATMHGLKKACSYIDGVERHSDVAEAVFWGGLALQTRRDVKGYQPVFPIHPLLGFIPIGNNSNFWVRLKTLGWDMGGAGSNSLYQDAFRATNLQIMPIINNLLYPAEPNMGIDKEYFRSLLCSAPCGGPCKKKPDYPNDDQAFPSFSCPNTPDWTGQRWENQYRPLSNDNRQFNGLDFMALYNLYLIYFPEERTPYFNPDHPENGISSTANRITGPDVLCPVNVGQYKVLSTYGSHGYPGYGINDLAWSSSSNLEKVAFDNSYNTADFRANTALNPSFVSASYKEDRDVIQYYNGHPNQIKQGSPLIWVDEKITDICDFTYRKPIVSANPVAFNAQVLPCYTDCHAEAYFNSNDIVSPQVDWLITRADNQAQKSGSGTYIEFCEILDLTIDGSVNVKMFVNSASCGSYIMEENISYTGCTNSDTTGWHRQVIVQPNPSNDVVTVNIIKGGQTYSLPSYGVSAQIARLG